MALTPKQKTAAKRFNEMHKSMSQTLSNAGLASVAGTLGLALGADQPNVWLMVAGTVVGYGLLVGSVLILRRLRDEE